MKRRCKPSALTRLDRCGVTGKVRYRSVGAAVVSLRRLSAQAATHDHRRERRPYHCWRCLGWHLTSQPKRPKELLHV
jgi:hypothetical protein